MSLSDLKVSDFLNQLGGGAATPGGGCASALAGAAAAALLAMTCRFTVGREKYRDSWETLSRVRDEADRLAGRLQDLIEADAEAYNRVLAAYRHPKATEEERQSRDEAVEEAIRGAAVTPLNTLRNVVEVLDLAAPALELGNPNCVTDAAVAVQLARAAGMGAAYNVRINLASLRNDSVREELSRETDELSARLLATAGSLELMVDAGLAR